MSKKLQAVHEVYRFESVREYDRMKECMEKQGFEFIVMTDTGSGEIFEGNRRAGETLVGNGVFVIDFWVFWEE